MDGTKNDAEVIETGSRCAVTYGIAVQEVFSG
jgi:hypothetical protein